MENNSRINTAVGVQRCCSPALGSHLWLFELQLPAVRSPTSLLILTSRWPFSKDGLKVAFFSHTKLDIFSFWDHCASAFRQFNPTLLWISASRPARWTATMWLADPLLAVAPITSLSSRLTSNSHVTIKVSAVSIVSWVALHFAAIETFWTTCVHTFFFFFKLHYLITTRWCQLLEFIPFHSTDGMHRISSTSAYHRSWMCSGLLRGLEETLPKRQTTYSLSLPLTSTLSSPPGDVTLIRSHIRFFNFFMPRSAPLHHHRTPLPPTRYGGRGSKLRMLQRFLPRVFWVQPL